MILLRKKPYHVCGDSRGLSVTISQLAEGWELGDEFYQYQDKNGWIILVKVQGTKKKKRH